jgi:glyoxylase-like metal-dependent hydrolase (beta-lactamase superfamily II)
MPWVWHEIYANWSSTICFVYNLVRVKAMINKNYTYYDSVQITDNLYCYVWQGRGNNSNTCLFTNVLDGAGKHIIIDPGQVQDELGEPCFDYLTKAITGDGFAIEDIGLIINTHSHTDHCQANPEIVKKSNALIAMSKEEEEFRHTGGKLLDSMFGIMTPRFTTSLFLTEGDLKLEKSNHTTEFKTIIAPGHSPGSVCIYVPADKVLITGDVIFYGSIGRTDFPGGSMQVLKESIDRLKQLDIEYILPGHGTEMGSIISGKPKIEQNFRMIQYYF